MKKYIYKPLAILLVKYLQRKYKTLSIKYQYQQSNQNIEKLKLIQYLLYFLKNQFEAWGYFHPSPVWSRNDEKEFNKLFPIKNFKELDIVIWHNPEAITYYKNKIYKYEKNVNYESEIRTQLKAWEKWN